MFNTEVETVKHTHIAMLAWLISMEQHTFKM